MNDINKTDNGQLPPLSESATLLAVISRASSDPSVDIDKMERLLAAHERMQDKQNEQSFNEAMSRVQAQMGRIGTDKRNNQTHSEYATYGKLDKVLRPIYTREGFALSFGTDPSSESMVNVTCIVTHRDGYSRKYQIAMPADGKGAKGNDVMTKTHATGSATQYGMRYLLKMIFNVAIGDEDDDGNAASDPISEKDQEWIRKVASLNDYIQYLDMKKAMLDSYGGNLNEIPPAVRRAFNETAAATKPKD